MKFACGRVDVHAYPDDPADLPRAFGSLAKDPTQIKRLPLGTSIQCIQPFLIQ